MSKGTWVMPEWMEPYRQYFHNTGGGTVEELYNDDGRNSNAFNNPIRGMICVAAKSQVALLYDLHTLGKI
jgi:hypothetical protein